MKMNKKRPILRRAAIPAVLALLCTLFWFGKPNDFGLGRNMELLVNMMRELSLFYVDEVDPDQLMQDAAEGMTRNLDPYTEFLPEEQMSNFDLLTTGKYGGIGSMIRKKGDYVIFAQPYEGSPADRAGIRIGDKILSIEGEDTKGWDPAQISSALKGTPNTTVRIVIERLIGGEHDTLTLTRERVAIPSVPYAGFVAKGIGYIQHSDFTEGSYEEMRTAIEKLRTQDTLRGLILDYRGNGGAILQEAVKIVSMFVPKGTEVVRTKGRAATQENVFRTANDPILPDLPLAVLINGNSASAAEIVAGSLQDLDRAVLIGQKSFGKGLVQTTRPLGYNTLLKLTTAKYYIPSGRCIQAIDYSSRKQDGTVGKVADSLVREFTTRGGRKVYDGGGISPDRASVHQPFRRYSAGYGIHRGFRGRIHAGTPHRHDRQPHVLDHRCGLRRLRQIYGRQGSPLRIGNPPGAQGPEGSGRKRPLQRPGPGNHSDRGRPERRHADQSAYLSERDRRNDQQRHRSASQLSGRRDRT